MSILKVAGPVSYEACGTNQHNAGLSAAIIRVLFSSCSMAAWDVHDAFEEWRFLLIDPHNAFNELKNKLIFLVLSL